MEDAEASGCLSKRMRKTVIDIIRGPVVKRRMASLLVVVPDPLRESLAQ